MKRAPRSRQRHDLYAKYHDYDSEISDLLGECGFTLLDVDSVILGHFAAATIAKHWLCLCTTTLDDAPISFARRSLIFPSLERFNRHLRWEYEEIAPSASFARKLEAALNHWLPLRMKFYHWTNTISASGHHVVDPDFDAIFRNVNSAR